MGGIVIPSFKFSSAMKIIQVLFGRYILIELGLS